MYDTTERIIENNQVHLRGKMVTGFSFSHELLGEGFYTAQVTVDSSVPTISIMKNITALSSMYLQQKWRFWKRRIIR